MTTHSTNKHKYIQLSDTIDKQTNNIAQLVDKVRRKIPVVNQSAKDVEEVTCRLEARADVAKSEIQKCFPRIVKCLQDREKVMFAEVEGSVARKSKVLNNQQERLEAELQKLQLTCTFTGKVIYEIRSLLAQLVRSLHSSHKIPVLLSFEYLCGLLFRLS